MRQNENLSFEIRDLILGTFQSDFQSLVQKIRNSGEESLTEDEKKKYMILNDVLTEGSDESLHKALIMFFPSYAKFYLRATKSTLTSSSKERQTISPYTTATKINGKLMAGKILTADEKQIFLHIIRICIQPLATSVSSNISLREKQKSSSRKRARTGDSFAMNSGGNKNHLQPQQRRTHDYRTR